MNGIVQSWGDSLKVFIPGNFKLFFLVTLKSFLEGAQVFLKYFWWLIVLQVVLLAGPTKGALEYHIWLFMLLVSQFGLMYFWLPSLRPSVGLKNVSYFVRYLMYLPLVLVLFVPYYYLELYSTTLPMHWLRVIHAMLRSITLFTVFFYLESDGSPVVWLKSIARALKFIVFNAPGILVFSSVFIVIMRKLAWIIEPSLLQSYVGHWENFIFFAVVQLFIIICLTFYHNYFIKRVHDQSELYFS